MPAVAAACRWVISMVTRTESDFGVDVDSNYACNLVLMRSLHADTQEESRIAGRSRLLEFATDARRGIVVT